MLEFNTALKNDVIVIELEGALDSQSAVDFRTWFQEKMTQGYRAFALDCLCLEYISSAGIASLIDLSEKISIQKGKVVLYQLSSETRQLVKFLGIDKKLNIVADYDEALGALTGYSRQTTAVETGENASVDAMVDVDEMALEEGLDDGKGLKPVAPVVPPVTGKPEIVRKPVAPAERSVAGLKSQTIEPKRPETTASEIKVDAIAQKLITCPNCRNVLRVKEAGDYLCPACRFRFAYKAAGQLL